VSLLDRFTSLISRSPEYEGPKVLPTGDSFEDGRERQMSSPRSITRWHLSDLEGAVLAADTGNLRIVGQLWRSLRRDGQIAGVLSTRCQGLVQLPIQMVGDEEALTALTEDFAQVFPTAELALLDADGVGCGVGVGEFVQIGDALPVLRRLDPEFLKYIWAEDRWFYQSIHGLEEINPGDGRWVLHCPGGAVQPWSHGLWAALGRAFIAKEHAFFYRENYSNKLANAARLAVSPTGANEVLKANWFQRVAQWGVNTVFDMPPGYDVKLLESNGRGFEVFQETIKTANEEIVITIAGQSVTTDGGSGFSNTAIHAAIRGDLIQADANALAMTLNSQCIPVWAEARFRDRDRSPVVEWDVSGSSDLQKEASAMNQAAIAVAALNLIGAPLGKRVDFDDIARRYRVKLVDTAPPPAAALPAATNGDETPADAPSDDAAGELAAKMTEHAVPRCEHGSSNRCRLCGVERVRDFTPGQAGDTAWSIAWRAIPKSQPALVSIPGGRAA
jgi:hypothetical protein